MLNSLMLGSLVQATDHREHGAIPSLVRRKVRKVWVMTNKIRPIRQDFGLPPSPRSLCSRGRDGHRHTGHSPPILQTSFHSSAVTGCTERREYFTSAMSASFFSALIAAMVTGLGIGLSALMSTQTNLPVLSVGSG